MCSIILNWLPIVLMCISSCSCKRWAAGFAASGESQLDFSADVTGTVKRDSNGGFVIVSDGDADVGANWKGGAYGGAHSAVDNKYYARQGTATGQLSGAIKPGLHVKIGRDGQGNWHREFKPRISVSNHTEFRGNGRSFEGEEAKTVAAVYRDESVTDETNTTAK